MLTLIKKATKSWLKAHNLHVYRRLPHGLDPLADLAGFFPVSRKIVAIDVGANVGQTTTEILRRFPHAHVHAFEPASSNLDALRRTFSGDSRVTVHPMALGAAPGIATLSLSDDSTMHRISTVGGSISEQQEHVTVDTLSNFTASNRIDLVDFLKIDTEGHDLQVLQGSGALLSRSAITAVQCECGMHPENTFHNSFEDVKFFMEQNGYRVFGVYEQVAEWQLKKAFLRRVNAVFVPSKLRSHSDQQ